VEYTVWELATPPTRWECLRVVHSDGRATEPAHHDDLSSARGCRTGDLRCYAWAKGLSKTAGGINRPPVHVCGFRPEEVSGHSSPRAGEQVPVNGCDLGLGQRRREPVAGFVVRQPKGDTGAEVRLVRQVLKGAFAQFGLDGRAHGGDGIADGGMAQFEGGTVSFAGR
jgi:hypothetical protein